MKLNEGYKVIGIIPTDKGEVALSIASGKPVVEKAGGSYLIKVQPKSAKMPLKGYTFTDSNVLKIAEKAIETDSDLILRFEKQRKKDVDKNIPMAELTPSMDVARKNVINACVGVYDVNNKRWVLDGAHSDPNLDGEEVERFIGWVTSLEQVDVDRFFENKQSVTAQQMTAPNPTTFNKQQCLLTLYFWVKECESKYGYTLNEESRRNISTKLLLLADKLYTIFKGVDDIQANYGDYAHTRARFAVFKYEECNEPLNEEVIKDLNAWLKRCYNFHKELAQWAAEQ